MPITFPRRGPRILIDLDVFMPDDRRAVMIYGLGQATITVTK